MKLAPLIDLRHGAFVNRIRVQPFEDFTVAFAGDGLSAQRLGIDAWSGMRNKQERRPDRFLRPFEQESYSLVTENFRGAAALSKLGGWKKHIFRLKA